MGKRGPKPTPTKVLAMRGSWRAKTREGEPVAPAKKPQCPKGLTTRARHCWRWLTEQLDAMGLLSTAEAKSIERYCVVHDLHAQALAEIHKHGQMVALYNSAGQIVQVTKNPLLAERGKLSAELLRLEQQFGLTPSARAGMKVPKPATPESQQEPDGQSRFFGGA